MYLGNGDGTFQSPTYLPYGPAFSGCVIGITMGDFNGDKELDIVGLDLGGEPSTSGSYCFMRERRWHVSNPDNCTSPPIHQSELYS